MPSGMRPHLGIMALYMTPSRIIKNKAGGKMAAVACVQRINSGGFIWTDARNDKNGQAHS